jgi:hypothetical protein
MSFNSEYQIILKVFLKVYKLYVLISVMKISQILQIKAIKIAEFNKRTFMKR